MVYNTKLAGRVREYLTGFPKLDIEEKQMFRGLAFLVNGKMCPNISGQNLMCRFAPRPTEESADKMDFYQW